jgi:pilus assembly protein CpaF
MSMFKEFADFGKRNRAADKVLAFPKAEPPVDKPQAEASLAIVQEDPVLQASLELKSRMHEVLLERLNLAAIEKVDTDELRREVSGLVNDALRESNTPMRSEEFKQLISELMDEVLGLGPLEPLMADPTINDILVNGHRSVFVERHGILEPSRARFRDERHLLRIIEKIVSRVGRRVDESNPIVDARLEDGSRVNAIIRPCAIDGPSLSIRKFSRKPLTLDRLVDIGTLSAAAARFLRAVVEARLNILISGGTGSGKTTLLNAISAAIDDRSRIVTIEDAAELQLLQSHVVRLETRPANPNGQGAIAQRELVRNALRMRPDRIIVGEVRGSEAFDMLQAMNTGHDGSMTTVHANSARDAIGRIEQMVTMIGMDMPLSAIRAQIASGVHVVIQAARLADGRRRVTAISEITGIEGNVITMQDLFVFRKQGKDDEGRVAGEFIATGIRPQCMETLVACGIHIDPADFIVRRKE